MFGTKLYRADDDDALLERMTGSTQGVAGVSGGRGGVGTTGTSISSGGELSILDGCKNLALHGYSSLARDEIAVSVLETAFAHLFQTQNWQQIRDWGGKRRGAVASSSSIAALAKQETQEKWLEIAALRLVTRLCRLEPRFCDDFYELAQHITDSFSMTPHFT